jgi:hypothetical protein
MEEPFDTPTLLGNNFDTFKDEIQEMILQQGFTNDEVVAALSQELCPRNFILGAAVS